VGNLNDKGAYKQSMVYQHPEDYLLPSHSGLFDGVFAGPLHRDTESVGLLPFSAAAGAA
jgi:hypothetical protein